MVRFEFARQCQRIADPADLAQEVHLCRLGTHVFRRQGAQARRTLQCEVVVADTRGGRDDALPMCRVAFRKRRRTFKWLEHFPHAPLGERGGGGSKVWTENHG